MLTNRTARSPYERDNALTTFYFNTTGNPVAFRRQDNDRFLFDTHGHWIGWFPWGDADAVDKKGKYLGTIVGNRLLSHNSQPYRGYPGYPGYPGYAGYPGYPGYSGYAGYIPGYSDIAGSRLKG